jgi:lysosomal Pro-X carboxypeptidase
VCKNYSLHGYLAPPPLPGPSSAEQAQADYADLAFHIQASYNVSQPVILFGGSYGGMLAAWSRMKYPGVWAGAVAASAPILGFQGQSPAYDPTTYWAVVTRDATPAGGSAPACSTNIRASWDPLFAAGATPAGRAQLASTFRLCDPPADDADMFALGVFILNALDTLAMGSFAFPSNYLSGGGDAPPLPAWPFRVACDALADPGLAQPGRSWELLAAVGAAAAVFNNATQDVACYDLPTDDVFEDGIWDVQWCTETLCEETYFARNGVTDMFWPWAITNAAVEARCADRFGFTPRWTWIAQSYGVGGGPPRGRGLGGSNIVLSNGAYDPWSSGGVVNLTQSTAATAARLRARATTPARKQLADAVEAAAAAGVGVTSAASGGLTSVWIQDGAHHVDLFFSNPADPATVTAARKVELALVATWTEDWYAQRGTGPGAAALRGEL